MCSRLQARFIFPSQQRGIIAP